MNDSSGFDQFQIWLMEMDDAIARFTASVPSDVRQKLDGTDASLNALEQWLLSNYASPAHAVSKSVGLRPEWVLTIDASPKGRFAYDRFRMALDVAANAKP